MGQHKHNPTAIAAKRGEIPPKPPAPSKRERERWLYAALMGELARKGLDAIPKVMEKMKEGDFT